MKLAFFFYWHPFTQNLSWLISHLVPSPNLPLMSPSSHIYISNELFPYKIHRPTFPWVKLFYQCPALYTLSLQDFWPHSNQVWAYISIPFLLIPQYLNLFIFRWYVDRCPFKKCVYVQIRFLDSLPEKSKLKTLDPCSHRWKQNNGCLFGVRNDLSSSP